MNPYVHLPLSLPVIKGRMTKFIKDWYFDIMTDFKSELFIEITQNADKVDYASVLDSAQLLKSQQQDRDYLLTQVDKIQNLYDVIALIKKMVDGNDYPFTEQEYEIFRKVFDVDVEEGDIVELTKTITY